MKTGKLGIGKAPEGGLSFVKGMLSKMTHRPEGMTYKTYKGFCAKAGVSPMPADEFRQMPIGGKMDLEKMRHAMSKGEEEEPETEEEEGEEEEGEEEEGEDEGDDMEMSRKARKSVVSASDLLKSIEAYDATQDALREGGTSRESYLVAKHDAGTLTKSERSELGRIWADEADNTGYGDNLHKSLYDVLADDDDAGALVDASDFLKSLVSGVDTRMTAVADEVGRQGRATRELLKAQGSLVKSLASIVAQQDAIIKSLGERLGTVEHSPAPRRAVRTNTRPHGRSLTKSVTGGTADRLSKSEIQTGLRRLMLHASEERDDAAMDRIMHATAKFEQTGAVSENILAAIRAV